MANPARLRALIQELDKLAKEYIAARDHFEAARQVFDAAKEKLVAVRKVAPEVLGLEWHGWVAKHPEVKMVGMDLGSAILAILQTKAYMSAGDRIRALQAGEAEKEYAPSMMPAEITDALDSQGFEFRTGTPRREVHAALLNLKGIAKVEREWGTEYQIEEAAEIYRGMREAYGLPADEGEKPEPNDDGPLLWGEDEKSVAAAADDNDVPF